MSWSEGGWVTPLAMVVIGVPAMVAYQLASEYHTTIAFLSLMIGAFIGLLALVWLLGQIAAEPAEDGVGSIEAVEVLSEMDEGEIDE